MSDDAAHAADTVRVVLVTVPNADEGCMLARRLVSERLAACGNVIPGLTSVYRWKGEVQEDPEALVMLKTTKEAIPALMDRVSELHSYEVPEFLVLPVEAGFEPYLRWVVGEIGSGGKAP
jgi:periplasmic divalent cation tolerance protein